MAQGPRAGMTSYLFRILRAATGVILAALVLPSLRAQTGRQFTATAVSSTEVRLNWTSGDRDAVYWFKRTLPNGQAITMGHVAFTSAFWDHALEPDTTYTYTLQVVKSAGYPDEYLTATVHTPPWQSTD